MARIDDIIGSAKLPEHTVRLCLDGDLAAEHERLSAELDALDEWAPGSLADEDPRVALAGRIRDIEERMNERLTPFTFRAVGGPKYRELLAAHPGKDGDRFDPDTFPRALVAASAVDPQMTPADVDRLSQVLSNGQYEALFMGAFMVNEGPSKVPFSKRASDLIGKRGLR